MTQARAHHIRRFLIQVIAVVVVSTIVGFGWMYVRTEQLLAEQALAQARSYVDLIVTTRAWNAHYEGVWVEKGPGVETNEYLLDLGVEPDVTTTDGRVFTLRNPALMTREISDSMLASGGVSFTLTSLKPVNPQNAPDSWEATALTAFAAGEDEAWVADRYGDVPVLRYMRPLQTEEACLECHASQGYKVGDVRGGVSVTVPLNSEAEILRENALWLGLVGAASIAILVALAWALVRRLSGRLEHAESALVRMATTDELTRLRNRRFVLERLHEEVGRACREGSTLGLIMLDLDHFKQVNDTHGHAFGDYVLSEAAGRMRESVRDYDVLGRIGGEEFLVVAPGMDMEGSVALAERIRERVVAQPIAREGASASMSVSAGVTTVSGGPDADCEREAEQALARADEALYAAKDAGRDTVATRP